MGISIGRGVLVRLKSGGPVLTVERVNQKGEESEVVCRWFDRDDIPHHETFAAATLVPVEGANPRPSYELLDE